MGANRPGNKFHWEGTYVHMYGHRDSMTESAQWADSVKINTVISIIFVIQISILILGR